MAKLWKRLAVGLVIAATISGAAVAVAPPALLIPPAVEVNTAPPCVRACCAAVAAEKADCCKAANCDQSKDCCKAGTCTAAFCKPAAACPSDFCNKNGKCDTDCCENGKCKTGCCKADDVACCPTGCCAPTMGVSLEWSGPPSARVGKPAEYTLTARNVCGKPVQRVTVQVKVPADVDVTAVMPAAKAMDGVYVWEVGTLAVGEAVPLTVTMASPKRGDLGCEAWVTCTGTSAMTVPVCEPKLEVAIKAPKSVVIGSKYTVEYTVTNVGDVVAEAVNCSAMTCDNYEPNHVIPELSAGESYTLTADYRATTPGEQTFHLAAVMPSYGPHAVTNARTLVEGVPALRMQVIDLADPVEKNSETTYEIRVTNTGTAPDANVTVACPLPGRLRMVSATGPTGVSARPADGVTLVRFDPIRELAPKTEAVFRVTVKAVGSGDVRFAAHLTSANLTTSVTKEESTRVYGE